VDAYGPRRPEEAARWLAALLLAAVALLLVVTPLTDVVTPLVAAVVGLDCALLLAGVVAIRRGWVPGAVPWLVVMVASVAMVLVSNLVTDDASTAAQTYFLLPAVASASQLRPRGAWLVAGTSALGHLAHVLVMLDLPASLVDWVSVTAFTAVFVGLLSRAADRQEELLAGLRLQADRDAVTGLSTRRVLDRAATAATTDRAGGAAGTALVIVDVDHFKAVNDLHGHPVGDAALAHTGRLLVDAAGPGAVVSRLGGDELAVLLPGASSRAGEVCAQRVVRAVRSVPLGLDGGGCLALTVSVGVAHSPTHAAGVEELYRAADAALYAAKRGGRDQVAVAVGRTAGPREATAPAPQRATVPLTPTTVPPPTQT